jgi:uncharacterized protein YjiK
MKSIPKNPLRLALLAGAMILSSLQAAPFSAGNLAVVQAAASANNTTASVVEVSPASTTPTTPIQTIAVDGTTLPNAIRISGSATSTGYVTNSADGSLLIFNGHNSATTGVNANTLTARGVVTFDAAGTFALATTYTGVSGQQTRSATTLNNTTWFIADQSGIFTNSATTASPAGNFRSIKTFGGSVYVAQASSNATFTQIATVSAATGGTATGLPGLTNNASLQDFFLIQSGDNGTAYDVLYTVSATSNTAGTIAKYSLVSGTWVANGTHTTTFGGFGLAAADSGSGALLYVSTGLGALTANSLLKITDTAGYNATLSITTGNNVTLYTAPAGAIIKGVAFAPVSATASPAAITSEPAASQTIGTGETATLSIVASGSPAPTYQWYVGNSGDTANPIPGAASASYTTPALTTTTSYWVRASNSGGTDDSITATVTVSLSTNASFSALTLGSGTLSPAFASGTLAYSIAVPNSTTTFSFTPTFGNANATAQVRINGGSYASVSSGSPSANLPLNEGANTVEILVTAQDGTTTVTYTITVTRAAPPAPTVLVAGDLMFTALNADEDGFAMVALRAIPANTTVYFTDNEWDGVSAFNSGEAYFQWVSGASAIPAGTVVRFSAIDNATNIAASAGTLTVVSGSAGFSSGEESLYAYMAESVTGTPTFISAICNKSFGTAGAGSIANTGLTLGNGAIQTGNSVGSDFAEYTGPRNNQTSFAAYLPIVSDIANWTDSGDGVYAATVPDTTAFTLAGPTFDTAINLANYVRIGRYDLPEPTRTTAPAGNLLCQEASGVTYNWDTDTLFIACDGGQSITQVSKTGVLIDTMTLALGSSPQGTEFYDIEGITYIGGGKFVFVEERDRQVVEFTYVAGSTLTRSAAKTVDLGTFVNNTGIEGLTYDPQTGGFICVKEISPLGLFQTGVDFNAGTATNGSASTVNSTDLFNPVLTGMSDFADVFALSNLPALNSLPNSGNLLVLSQEDARIVNIDRTGVITSTLQIVADPGSPLSAPAQQHEGLTMDRNGILYIVNENGGGSIDYPQLWVYAPAAFPNAAPTAIALDNATTTIVENTPALAAIKVADIAITDDGIGTNTLSITGTDAAFFEITGAGLYLKAGTVLDYEIKASYSITVNVDDTSLGSTPDASVNYTLAVTDIVEETPVAPTVFISEIHPNGSSNGTYNADWFEITNAGTTPVNVTGWQMDDNSNGSAKVALRGVTTIPAGKSAIFFEGAADGSTDATILANFCTAWFGSPTAPAGLLIGAYGGGGVGLSSGGDSVNVFDNAGVRVAGAAFGTSTAGVTFDNHAALNSITLPLPTVSLTSLIGKNGAFLSANNTETGSPGTTGKLLITEVAPWASSTTLGADWFEVTNTSATTIDITGWRMDDSSETFAGTVALNGITSIAPGESVIFIETTDLAGKSLEFLATWFGTHAPSGLRIGSYTGSGVGLSGTADAVNLYDGSGVLQAKVTFGASPASPYATFDNATGIDFAAISTLSVVGTNGAIIAVNEPAQTGSPGSATVTTSSLTGVQAWRKVYFGTTANTGLTADTADFDGDGVANLLEYALGGEPTDSSTAEGTGLLPVGTAGDTSSALLSDRLSLAFIMNNPNPADLTYTVEATADLITWDPVATKTGNAAWTWVGGGTERIVTSGTSVVTVKVGDLVPTEGNPRRMMRLKISTP